MWQYDDDEDDDDDGYYYYDYDDDDCEEDDYDPFEHQERVDEIDALKWVGAVRPVHLVPGPAGRLENLWGARVGDCGAGEGRLERGIAYLQGRSVEALGVDRRRLFAKVVGSWEYRVDVEIRPPPRRLTAAICRGYRAAARAEYDDNALLEAIVAAGPEIFPTPKQLINECTCPEGARCKHVVAAVLGLGTLLDADPWIVFTLWGRPEPRIRRGRSRR